LIWLPGRLSPDFKTIADFRRDNGVAIRKVYRDFVVLCRRLKLFSDATAAIGDSEFKALNNGDKNFTKRKRQARTQQLEHSIARYMNELNRADRDLASLPDERIPHLKDKIKSSRRKCKKLGEVESKAYGLATTSAVRTKKMPVQRGGQNERGTLENKTRGGAQQAQI